MEQLGLFASGVKAGHMNIMMAASGVGKTSLFKKEVQVLEEITEWEFPNHTYYIDPDSKRMVGYRNVKTGAVHVFTGKGLSFDRRNRKFKRAKLEHVCV